MTSKYGLLWFALHVGTFILVIMGRWDIALLLWGIAIPALIFGSVLTVLLCAGVGVVLGLNVGVFAWAVWWLLGVLAIAFPVLMVAGRVMARRDQR
jgi:hypothetical protein